MSACTFSVQGQAAKIIRNKGSYRIGDGPQWTYSPHGNKLFILLTRQVNKLFAILLQFSVGHFILHIIEPFTGGETEVHVISIICMWT